MLNILWISRIFALAHSIEYYMIELLASCEHKKNWYNNIIGWLFECFYDKFLNTGTIFSHFMNKFIGFCHACMVFDEIWNWSTKKVWKPGHAPI